MGQYHTQIFEDTFIQLLIDRPEIIKSKSILTNCLKDILAGYVLESNLLLASYDTGIVDALRKEEEITQKFTARFVKRMIDANATHSEMARWAVNFWCFAYGVQILNLPANISELLGVKLTKPKDETEEPAESKFKVFQNNYCSFLYSYQVSHHGMVVDRILNIGKGIKIPEEIDDKPVVAIGKKAFAHRNDVKKIQIPDTVKYIGRQAFYNCTQLKSVTLPSMLKEMGNEAFAMSGIESIHIPGTLATINERMFSFCNRLSQVQIDSGVMAIGDYAFSECAKLEEIVLPYSINRVGEFVFESVLSRKSVKVTYGNYQFDSEQLSKKDVEEQDGRNP
ncbi:MAG: leucine-rich repeat domain-containing protein [Lachnospiraceae bacterium]|nr:leucine-rich repeat domain-containing protein [Lachnospiraceae bacterium]